MPRHNGSTRRPGRAARRRRASLFLTKYRQPPPTNPQEPPMRPEFFPEEMAGRARWTGRGRD